jgi:bifunctional UDP-N-acetylglucosamine pyrophosphorylase/glucosamine-1-phosphate N-acetyltransferase
VVLAAGQGTRMRSQLPKMLHTIAGKPILGHILQTVSQLNPKQTLVVYGHQGEQLKAAFAGQQEVIWVPQTEQRGTGHAALQVLPHLAEVEQVLIWYGDIPLMTEDTLTRLLALNTKEEVRLVSIELPNPAGLGRIVRNEKNEVVRIVEDKDASALEKQIKEVNTGFFLVPKKLLQKWLPKLQAENAQHEYYLTQLIDMAVSENIPIETVSPNAAWEVLGINNRTQLAELERIYQYENAKRLMEKGVTLRDPARFDQRGEVNVGVDITIDVNVILEGTVTLGNNVTIGANVCIKDSIIDEGVRIQANSVIDSAKIAKNCIVGPFARIRPGTVLEETSQVGNFVEVKNSKVGVRSKMNHLSYIGDAIIGSNVNIGAGTITCNYDGVKKHQTIIEDDVFIGSDSQLIAPLTVGKGATIGAGTTVVKDVLAKSLIHHRNDYRYVENWQEEDKK